MFKARDVLVDILPQINQYKWMDATLSKDALMLRLTKLLKGITRLLIVLDDVETIQVRKSFVSSLISFSSHEGGKIIIIVRNTDYLPQNGYSTLNICKLNNERVGNCFRTRFE